MSRGFKALDFSPAARPQGDEGVAENAAQLVALCQEVGVNHLIYAGVAINWCLLMSPGGMLDMSRRGVMCSAFRAEHKTLNAEKLSYEPYPNHHPS